MKIPVSIPLLHRRALILALATVVPLLLTQCKSTGGSYKDVEYDPSTLKTPSGHGMEKKDYPFDDDGRYRKEWVRNKATGKTRSASKLPEPQMVSADGSTQSADSVTSTTGYYGPVEGPTSNSPAPEDFTVAAATPAPVIAETNYHKVVSGDTLYSLSRRYGTSVDELKRVNGLSSDSIRTGQSLRLP